MLAFTSAACRSTPTPWAANIAYGPHTAQRLDVYAPRPKLARPAPIVVLIHGGGWERGSRSDNLGFIPFFTVQGYAVANIDYQLAADALAPAAAVDVRNAVEFVRIHAAEWNADPEPMMHDDAVLARKRHDVGHGGNGDQLQQRLGNRSAPRFRPSL